MARYGSTVTYTVQLQGDDLDPDATDKVDAGLGDNEIKYTLVTEVYSESTATGNAVSKSTSTVEVGADGSATFTVTARDPDTSADGAPNQTTVVSTLSLSVTNDERASDGNGDPSADETLHDSFPAT